MSLDRHELFEKLLDQLQLKGQARRPFRNGRINALEIHAKSNRWQFDLQLEHLLPYRTFVDFYHRLLTAFKSIADVNVSFKVQHPRITNDLLQSYWSWVVKHSGLSASMVQQLCGYDEPKLNDQRVTFAAQNQVVKDFLEHSALKAIEQVYHRLGFVHLKIHVLVNPSQSQAQLKAFKAKKAKADAKLAQKAMAAIDRANQKRSHHAHQAAHYSGSIRLGRKISDQAAVTKMADISQEERSVVVHGYVFEKSLRTLKSGNELLILKMTDYTSSIEVKKFSRGKKENAIFNAIQQGSWLKVQGPVRQDRYLQELTITAYDINPLKHQDRQDTAPRDQKRVELHLHSTMSKMDGITEIGDYVKRAKKWGMPALAITDHAAVQGFPAAYRAGAANHLKIIYGMEANVVDDGRAISWNHQHRDLKRSTYVIYDTETTGLSAVSDRVIELSAVKMHYDDDNHRMYHKGDGQTFEEFIDPGFPIPQKTTRLTSITENDVKGSKSEAEVFREFRKFCGDSIIVGHNVTFDNAFLNEGYRRHGMPPITNPVIDTLPFARALHPEFKNFKLDTLTNKFHVALVHHHRAIADAAGTARLNNIFVKEAVEKYHLRYDDQLNNLKEKDAYKHAHPFHVVLLAKNQTGLKNIFKLVSLSNIKYFYRAPRIPRSVLEKHRKGILIGSACHSGEVFVAMMQKGFREAMKVAQHYDYLEIQPPANYQPLLDSHLIHSATSLRSILAKIVKVGQKLNLPVVATGDCHYLDPHDYVYRKILIHSQGGANPLNRETLPEVPFRTTDEMLKDFHFLGTKVAKRIVVNNTQLIAHEIGDVHPVRDRLYPPTLKNSESEVKKLSYGTAHAYYGNPMPTLVKKRLDRELKSIIGNGFSVIYLIGQRLVAKSNKDGYLVGSRGSVGSSLVATMMGITEVNPLPPHYRCPKCKYTRFFLHGEYNSGFDLPLCRCPKCGTLMVSDGHGIPFETFLGFSGNKVPDIDLNFSGDYQPIAHNYMKVLFGEKNVYRAGTVGTVANKTAYGYVKAYERDANQAYQQHRRNHPLHLRTTEIDRLAKGTTGTKRTTGQHPAGIIIVPKGMDIYDFTPIQYPANDSHAAWETTHFDFHSIHDNMLKMDILGHQDPTTIRMLQDLSGIDPKTIPMNDPGVMSLFSSPKALGVKPEAIGSKTGTLGLPEFGTHFVRGMLGETHPSTFSELLQISGLSHGTGVWLGNAEDLINEGKANITNVIACRDNIMADLIKWGIAPEQAFQTMESVRHGLGIKPAWEKQMRASKTIPSWYTDSCLKIQYMFPRAHAVAYVMMALRIAYFKVYFPIAYYAAYFSIRADDFDIVSMCQGKTAVEAAIKRLRSDENQTAKDKSLLTVMESANEMLARGYHFKMVDLKRSDAVNWVIDGKNLIAPFRSIPGLGLNVAKQIVAARSDKPFISKEDLSNRGKVSKTIIQFMDDNGITKGLPDRNQLSLFDTL